MNNIFIISGPSGSGKSTLIKMILNDFRNVSTVVSHTTRAQRDGEKDRVHYHFISEQRFQEMIDNEQFVEHVQCFGNYYGTSIISIQEALKNHDSCIMDLEWNGAFNILHNQKITEAKLTGVLILPPSIKALKDRLNNRRSESEETLGRRIRESFMIDRIAKYDHVIINNNLCEAYAELRGIIHGNH